MIVKLSDDDRCAIDLVLQERTGDASVPAQCFDASAPVVQEQVKRVQKLFSLIGQMPAAEPPESLVKASLKHISKHEHDAVLGAARDPERTVISHSMSQRPLQ